MIKNKNTEAEGNKVAKSKKLTIYEKKRLHNLVVIAIVETEQLKKNLKDHPQVETICEKELTELTEIKRKLE